MPKLKLGITELKEGVQDTLGHGIRQPRSVKRGSSNERMEVG